MVVGWKNWSKGMSEEIGIIRLADFDFDMESNGVELLSTVHANAMWMTRKSPTG